MNDDPGIWRGQIEQRVTNHERRLTKHFDILTAHTEALGEIRSELASLRAKVTVAAGAGSVLGGVVVAVVIQVLFR